MFALPITGPEQCSTCRHYRQIGTKDFGHCHRYPPALNSEQVKFDYTDQHPGSESEPSDYTGFPWTWSFPAVHDDDVCGEYRRATAREPGS
jgi:hypothetical protein